MAIRGTDTIATRLAFEGGDELKRALLQLAEAGAEAFKKLGDAVKSTQVPLKALRTSADEAADSNRRLTTELRETRSSIEGVGHASEQAGSSLAGMAKATGIAIGGIGLALSGAAAAWIALAKSAADSAVAQKNAADKIGVSLKQLRQIDTIAEVFGVSSDAIRSAVGNIQDAITKGTDVSKKSVNGFTEVRKGYFALGTEIETTALKVGDFYEKVQANGRKSMVLVTAANLAEASMNKLQNAVDGAGGSLSETQKYLNNLVGGLAKATKGGDFLDVFAKVAQTLEGIPDPAKRAFLITKLGLESVAPLLTSGVQAFQKYRKALEDVGAFEPLSQQQTKTAQEFTRLFTTIQLGIKASREKTRIAFVEALIDPLEAVLGLLKTKGPQVNGFLSGLAKSAGKLAADIIRAFTPTGVDKSGNLVFGMDVDKISDANKGILTFRDTILQFGRDVLTSVSSIVIPAWQGFLAVVKGVTAAVNGFLGTSFGDFELLAGGVILKVTGFFKLLGLAVGGIVGVFTSFGKAALVAAGALLAFTSGNFDTALEKIKGFFAGASEAIGETAEETKDALAKYKSTVKNFAIAFPKPEGLEQIPKAIGDAANKTKQQGNDLLGYIRTLFADIGNALRFKRNDAGEIEFIDTAKVSDANQWVIQLRDTIVSFKDDVVRVAESIIAIWTRVTDGFNWVFNTKFSPGQLAILLALAQMTGALTVLVGLAVGLNALIGIVVTLGKAVFGLAAALLAASLPAWAFVAAITAFAYVLGKDGLIKAIKDVTQGILDFSGGPVKDLGKNLGEPWKQFKNEADASIGFAEKRIQSLGRFKLSIDASEALKDYSDFATAVEKYRAKMVDTIKFPKPVGASASGTGAERNDIDDDLKDIIDATEEAAKGFAPIGKASDKAADQVSDAFGEIKSQITSLPTDVIDEEAFVSPFRRIVEVVRDLFNVQLPSALQSAASAISDVMSDIASTVEETLARIEEALARARAAASEASALGGGGGGGSGFASGGFVRGPGSGTSDSIPAWLSSGEFVVRAAAVRQYGVDFLRAINGMRFDPQRYHRGVRAFAMGGLVDTASRAIAMPAVAASGPQRPGKSFDLVIDGQRFANLMAPDRTAENLMRYAAEANLRSAGRPPGWKR